MKAAFDRAVKNKHKMNGLRCEVCGATLWEIRNFPAYGLHEVFGSAPEVDCDEFLSRRVLETLE